MKRTDTKPMSGTTKIFLIAIITAITVHALAVPAMKSAEKTGESMSKRYQMMEDLAKDLPSRRAN